MHFHQRVPKRHKGHNEKSIRPNPPLHERDSSWSVSLSLIVLDLLQAALRAAVDGGASNSRRLGVVVSRRKRKKGPVVYW